jgi:hypothetical protein
MLLDLWGWVGDLKQGQATVLGLAGGFFTLVVGALINAGLNRRRDDRLRREDQRAVATALRAELEGLRRTLSDAAEAVSQEGYLKSDEQVNVPDLAQSIQIMPAVVSKFGLLDGTIISAVVDAYGMVEEYSAKLLLLGGRPGVTPDNFRRYVALPPDRLVPLARLNIVTAEVIQKAIVQLGITKRWRDMSWRERVRWLRSTG